MPRNRNGRQNRNTTKVVVQSTSGNQQAQAASRPRRQRRPTVNVNVTTARPQQQTKQRSGVPVHLRLGRRPRRRYPGRAQHEIHQRITTTLGTVGSNSSGGVENEMTVVINPSTMKEQTGSTSFGPLSVLASQYALWRVNRIEVTLKQLVGNNAASGTVARVSAVPNTSASQVSWSSLGARRHADVDIGKNGRFVITARELRGPKDGWYFTNTNLDSCDACAGILQIHTLGKTMNPYQNKPYSGPLFLAEVTTDWSFRDYQQNPGMLNMVKSETAQNATIEVDSNNKILMKVGNTTGLGTYAQNPSAAEVVWVVTDTIINTGADIFPAPFNWLFKGGWWVIKRLAGAPVGGETGVTYFEVFTSIADAQNNKPCYASGTNNTPVTLQQVSYQQITPSNLGTPGESLVAQPPAPTPQGPQDIVTTSMHTIYGPGGDYTPSGPVFTMRENVPGPLAGIGVGDTGKIYTWNLHKVTVRGPVAPTGPPVVFTDDATVEVGYVVATNHIHFQAHDSDNHPVDVYITNVLFKATADRAFTFSGSKGPFVIGYYDFNRNNPRLTTGSELNNQVRLVVQPGGLYVAQYLCVGPYVQAKTQVVLGSPVYEPQNGWNTTQVVYSISPTSGDPTCGLPVSYATPLVFRANATTDDFVDASDTVDGLAGDFYYDDPPEAALEVLPEVKHIFESLIAGGVSRRRAALAVNQIAPSVPYQDFVATYHDSLVNGMDPESARTAAIRESLGESE